MPRTDPLSGGNLPGELTSFIGRRRELAEVKPLLAESRLVTLTGVGGTGKTRLALRAATEVRRAFPDGVWFVDLSTVRASELPALEMQDPDVVAYLVLLALGAREQPGAGSPTEQLVRCLAPRRSLLVLDNCEQLLPVCAILAEALLRGCPQLQIVAASREPLLLTGEVIFAVPPLPVPEAGGRAGVAEMGQCEAVALFVARAQAVKPGFALTEQNAAVVGELCRRLDGLPLALELAAARVLVLAPAQILDRLAARFALLSCGRRNMPERQQTLRACVDWSFDLCTKPERILWARSSVFAGGFELDAAEDVCADDEQLPPAEILDAVAGLVDKSILVGEDSTGNARYRMLETIRDYGQDKLVEADEQDEFRRRHRDWCQRLVAHAQAEWVSDRQPYWLDRLCREHPNLRAAVEYCLTEPGKAEQALRLGATLPNFYWTARGLFSEGRRWLDRALAVTPPDVLHARALLINSYLAFAQGDAASGTRLLQQGEALAERLDSPAERAYAAFIQGLGALFVGQAAVAVRTLQPARTVLAQLPQPDADLHLHLLGALGVAAELDGNQQLADACREEMLAMTEHLRESYHRSAALWACGLIAWHQGRLDQAETEVRDTIRLALSWASYVPYLVALCLETLAWIVGDLHRPERAATLLGIAEAVWTDINTPMSSYQHLIGFHDACERQAREALGDDRFAKAFHAGRSLTYEDGLAYALEHRTQPTPAPAADTWARLTRREQQVAELVARGMSNKDIAAKLVISQRTAESHVEHILTKLGFINRSQVAAGMAAQRRTTPQGG